MWYYRNILPTLKLEIFIFEYSCLRKGSRHCQGPKEKPRKSRDEKNHTINIKDRTYSIYIFPIEDVIVLSNSRLVNFFTLMAHCYCQFHIFF